MGCTARMLVLSLVDKNGKKKYKWEVVNKIQKGEIVNKITNFKSKLTRSQTKVGTFRTVCIETIYIRSFSLFSKRPKV